MDYNDYIDRQKCVNVFSSINLRSEFLENGFTDFPEALQGDFVENRHL